MRGSYGSGTGWKRTANALALAAFASFEPAYCQNFAPAQCETGAAAIPEPDAPEFEGSLFAPIASLTAESNPSPSPSPWTTGTKAVLVMRVVFPDDPTPPCSEEEAERMIRESSQFYEANASGRISLTPAVTPLLMLPRATTEYLNHPQRHFQMREDALTAAAAAGFDLGNHPLDVVVNGRLFGFRANVGQAGCWLQAASTDAAIHELGHNLGLGHANLWVGRGDTVIGPGVMKGYGNMLDAMADTVPGQWAERHFNVAAKHQLGWLDASQILTVTTSGVYRVYAADSDRRDSDKIYALIVRKDTGRDYWLECRQRGTNNVWVQNGLLLYFGPWSESYGLAPLLDMTPNSQWRDDSRDAALTLGRTFSDRAAAVHITPLARDSESPSWMEVYIAVNHAGTDPGQQPAFELLGPDPNHPVAPGTPTSWLAESSSHEASSVSVSWDFGDGTLAGPANIAVKSWTAPGEYQVRCRVTDRHGGESVRWRNVTVGQPATFRVQGRVTLEGQPLAGVRISWSDEQAVYTDEDGRYAVVGLTNGWHQLHPGAAYFRFEPGSRLVEVRGTNVTDLDFEAVATLTPNNPPYVLAESPTDEAVLPPHSALSLRAWAYDDGSVVMVQFESDTDLAVLGQGSSLAKQWTNVWVNPPLGEHLVTVRAIDDAGAVGATWPRRVRVRDAQSRVASMRCAEDGRVELTVWSSVTGVWAVEHSTNLTDWIEADRATNGPGLWPWTEEPGSARPKRRFYRVRPR